MRVWVARHRVTLVWCLDWNTTLLQAAEDAESNVWWDLIFELLNGLPVQSLDTQVGLHKVRADLEQGLSCLLDAWVFGVEACTKR